MKQDKSTPFSGRTSPLKDVKSHQLFQHLQNLVDNFAVKRLGSCISVESITKVTSVIVQIHHLATFYEHMTHFWRSMGANGILRYFQLLCCRKQSFEFFVHYTFLENFDKLCIETF